jgi:uncharacterized protein YkwD
VAQNAGGLADPRARRWVILGALGVASSLLLTVGVALLSNRGVASASTPPVVQARQAPVTYVREIGGIPKSPTPGTGVTASAPSNPGVVSAAGVGSDSPIALLRQLRRVGRAIMTPDGIRHLALGGAIPFVDAPATTAAAEPSTEPRSVAFAGAPGEASDSDDSTATVFLRAMDVHGTGLLSATGAAGQSGAVVLASPGPVTDDVTPVPATATSVSATATAVPATAMPATATPVVVTATSLPATATPVVITATPLPATATPVVVTATPDPTRRPTRTPLPDPVQQVVVIVTATPWTNILPGITMPFQPAATATPLAFQPAATNTPIATATSSVVLPTRAASAADAPAAQPAAAQPAAAQPIAMQPTATTPPLVAQAAAPTATPVATATPSIRRGSADAAPIVSEAGTRTPATPLPQAAARQPGTPTGRPGQPTPAPASATAADGNREPTALEKFATRALVAVNTARAQAGALPLSRNAALDMASALHARYDVSTGQIEGNFQAPGTPLFVGETPAARVARAAGGRAAGLDRVAEVMALGEMEPERVVQGWLDSVYHRIPLLDLAAQSGGYGQQTTGSATTAVLDVSGRREVANASGWFPASGATEVPTRCVCDDYAEATGKAGPFGYPVTLLLGQIRPQGLPATARLLEGSEAGPQVPADLVDAFGNPTLVPNSPLKPSTRYVVQLAWNNGPSVTWAFVTAAQ